MAQIITAGEVVTVHNAGAGHVVEGTVVTGLVGGGYAVAWSEILDPPGPLTSGRQTIVARLDVNDTFIDLDGATAGNFRNINADVGGYGSSSASISDTSNGGFVVSFIDSSLDGTIARFDAATFNAIDHFQAAAVAGLAVGGYVGAFAADSVGDPAIDDAYATTHFSGTGGTTASGPTNRVTVGELGDGYVLAYSGSVGGIGYVNAKIVDPLHSPIDITVNQTATSSTRLDGTTSVAELANGNFAIAWRSGTGDKVFVRVFQPNGTAVTNEIWVDQDTAQDWPVSVVGLKDGGFAVLWVGSSAAGIKVYDNNGNQIGDPFWDFDGGESHAVITGMSRLESGELLVAYQGGTYGYASVQKLTVGSVSGAAPTDITGKLEWTEGKSGVVGTLAATDADDSTGFVWSLIDDAGGRFVIDAATGKVTVAKPILLDFEQAAAHSIIVKVTDNDGNSFTKVLSAKGTDVAMEDLTLTAQADKVFGGAKVDTFSGGKGNDTIRGGGGKDVLDGGKGKDTADYSDKTKSVEVTLNGSKEVTVKVGGKAEDSIKNFENVIGGSKADTLTGDSGSNTFHGGKGKDVLDGKGGKDFFVFDTQLGNKHADTIEGFTAKDDTIVLDHTIFTALAAGPLAADAFLANKTGEAASAEDRIIYDKKTGKLFYDADGSGAGEHQLFATLDGHPKVTAADFTIV